ncbi:MAG: lysylphosphatidylglycerol synthase transmembrane domain-containing protein, partial [Aggregatilineales bacterium]
DVNPVWLAIGAITYFAAVAVIALRWQFVLRAVKVVPLSRLTQIVAIGYMGNNVYPLRAGEALRIFLLRRNENIPVTQSTTTVIVERVFDGLVMLSFIVLALATIQIESEEIRTVATFAAGIFLPAMGVFFVLAAQPNLLRKLIAVISHILPGTLQDIIAGISEDIIQGLEALRSPVNLAGAVVCSFITWSIEALVYWMVMQAFSMETGYAVALLVVGTVNLAGLIPASPGQVGVYEFFASTVLIAVGIAQDTALAYAIVVHIVIWLPVTLAGFFFFAKMGLSRESVQKARELETETVTG